MLDFKIVIEHLEERITPWLLFEYINASRLVGRDKIIFSNIPPGRASRILSRYGEVYPRRIREYCDTRKIIILDLKAEKMLEKADIRAGDLIVIGGILGSHPPMGRTGRLLTRHYPGARVRSLGRIQFSIDGAAYVASLLASGRDLREIDIVYGLYIPSRDNDVILPYAYPIVGSRPIISRTLRRLLELLGPFDDYWDREIG
jgi:ribosome biogenesis SPOUT family RNA methylase Rps3